MGERARKSVLLVEDDPSVRKLVHRYLVELDADVTPVADGRSALRALTEKSWDLLCLDLMLPESSGFEVCETVRKTPGLEHVPVVMMSARTTPNDRAQAEEVGVTAYLIKPFTRADFVRTVQDAITLASQQAAAATKARQGGAA